MKARIPDERRAAPRRWSPALGLAAALAGVTTLAACTRPEPSPDRWFPLEPGHEWVYEMTVQRDGEAVARSERRLRTLDPEPWRDRPTWRRRSDDGVGWWLRSDETGTYRVASKNDLEAEPEADPMPRYVLHKPYKPGTRWQVTTTTYLLRQQLGFVEDLGPKYRAIPMEFSIEAADVSVEVPAGRYDGCLRVRGDAPLKLYADGAAGWRSVPITTTEWYCPEVGLVRLERDEPAPSHLFRGGRITMELQSWR